MGKKSFNIGLLLFCIALGLIIGGATYATPFPSASWTESIGIASGLYLSANVLSRIRLKR